MFRNYSLRVQNSKIPHCKKEFVQADYLIFSCIVNNKHLCINPVINKDNQWIKNPPANAGDTEDAGSIPGSGDPLEEEDGSPPQCSCLKTPWAVQQQESDTTERLTDTHTHTHTHTLRGNKDPAIRALRLSLHAKLLQSCPTLCDPTKTTRLLCPWNSQGQKWVAVPFSTG